jgi:hypothetical protein
MRVLRGLLLSPLVPLLGVAVLGIGAGYRSFTELGGFVLMWAVVLYPLVAAIALGVHALGRWLGLTAHWHFGVGGVVVGALLAFLYFAPVRPAGGGSPFLPTAAFCSAAGALGFAAMVVYWRLALGARAA